MSGGIPRLASSLSNRSDGKPCSIITLANEMNQIKGRVTIAADNHVTQRYMPPHPAPGSREPLAIDLETGLSSRCIFGEPQPMSDQVPSKEHRHGLPVGYRVVKRS